MGTFLEVVFVKRNEFLFHFLFVLPKLDIFFYICENFRPRLDGGSSDTEKRLLTKLVFYSFPPPSFLEEIVLDQELRNIFEMFFLPKFIFMNMQKKKKSVSFVLFCLK